MSLNKVILFGRLVKDPDVKVTQTGIKFCSFTVAVDRRKKDKDDNPGADFITCQAWRGIAEYLENYGKKGNQVLVDGRINTRNYDRADGTKVYVTEVVCENVNLTGQTQNGTNKSEKAQKSDEPKSKQTQMNLPKAKKNIYGNEIGSNKVEDIEIDSDDLPF